MRTEKKVPFKMGVASDNKLPFELPSAVELNTLPLKMVSVASLQATQSGVRTYRVKNFIENPGLGLEPPRSPPGYTGNYPLVARYKGKNLIVDGHHRLAAYKLMNVREAKVRYIDM